MSSCNYDTLIIGQGLAGSILAWRLIHAGQRVRVIDDELATSSSKAAAGLINPLAGMRFNCPPHTAQWLDNAHQLYQTLEDAFDQQFHFPLGMLRLFRSEEQKRFHQRRKEDPVSKHYLGDSYTAGNSGEPVDDEFGSFEQSHTGYIETKPLLSELRDWLESRDAYHAQRIDHNAIRPQADRVTLGNLQATQLIFCEGFRVQQNPWFRYLPMTPDKGEILTLRSEKKLASQMINGAHWLIPLANGKYRFGATHEHQQLDNQPTGNARTQLIEGMNKLLHHTGAVCIADHEAGVRPSTRDRLPFIGAHPQEPRLKIFNGFGARGALTIPWYAQQFVAHLLNEEPLPQEADIRRIK